MRKIVRIILVTFLWPSIFYCQSNGNNPFNSLIPGDELVATPDVMAFHKYNSLPINLYTGKIEVNLPLYEITSGNINIPISLSYNSGGIKVDDIASNVGLGWNLNASGSVATIIKDIPDQTLRRGLISENDWDHGSITYEYVTQKGYLREYDEILQINSHYDLYQGYDLEAEEDASPDIFIANAPGLSSRFILEKNNNSFNILPIDGSGIINSNPITYGEVESNNLGFQLNELEILDYNGYSPTTNWTDIFNYYGYHKFELINTNGIKYIFDKKDLRESLSRQAKYSPTNGGKVTTSVTAHHLSSMFDPRSNTTVNFNYEEYQKATVQHERSMIEDALTNHVDPDDWVSVKVFGHLPLINSFNENNNQINENVFRSSLNYIKYKKAHRLSKINFHKGAVEFVYGHIRQDAYDENALTEIVIKDIHNSIIKRFEFDYDYFISKENCSQPECKRLKLERVRQIGRDDTSIDLYTLDYNYTNPLPKVKALQQDFLGYYNNNGVTTPETSSTQRKQPILYYHKNQGANSILPFPIQDQSHVTITGDYSLQSNDYSLTGTLKSIQYVTGGKSEFEYETHRFNFLGKEYTAGGARIKSQRLTDENQNVKVLEYEYKHGNDKSSGYINNIPVFGYPYMWDPSKTTNNVSFTVFDKSRSALELTDGSFVGYSEVIEKEIGNGHTIHKFISPETAPNIPETYITSNTGNPNHIGINDQAALNFLKNNSAYPFSNYVDNDILRGKPSLIEYRNESNETLKTINYDYKRKIFNTLNLSYRDILDNYGRDDQNLDFGTWHFYHSSELNIERNLQSKKITTDYLENGNRITEETFQYDDKYPFLKQYSLVDNTNTLQTNTYYPFDYEINSLTYMTDLILQNRVAEPIREENKFNNRLTNMSMFDYGNFNNEVILPRSISKRKGDELIEEKSIIDSRDENGNILQFHKKDDISQILIWGYNNQYPIAKIANASYTGMPTEVIDLIDQIKITSNTENSSTAEASMRTNLETLRSHSFFANAEMSYYTYDPLIGVTSMTDPRGYTMYYEYDGFNRLSVVRDEDGNILSENQYHYKNN
ncbi:RHS repeat domain-containing protein [uncultured Aquimarina sp.]|uniref:RHS repeat domain-containing protein n=1 Tax=uncultured Aquimarina sp. TaxID=575652 RepID=UPI0026199B64|nr:RHS repeat domain-containing protein [uncultured Aquimarina sp.]